MYPIGRWQGAGSERLMWVASTMPYMKSYQIYKCPSDTNESNNVTSFWLSSLSPTPPNFRTSYGYNYNFSYSDTYATDWPAPVRQSRIQFPATTVMASDAGMHRTGYSNNPAVWTEQPETWIIADRNNWRSGFNGGDWSIVGAPSSRHLETSTVLYVDGHVKSQKVDSFYLRGNCLNLDTGC